MHWLISSILAPEKWKTFNVTVLLRQSFFVNTVYHRITHNSTSTRWPKRIIVCFLWLLFVYISVLKIIALFLVFVVLLFSNNDDLHPTWSRYSLCFSSLMVFSWSSVFLFKGSWLIILTLLNLASESLDLTVLQTEWESEALHVSPKSHIFPPYYRYYSSGYYCWDINNFILRANFCFEKFSFFFKCGNFLLSTSFIFFFVV